MVCPLGTQCPARLLVHSPAPPPEQLRARRRFGPWRCGSLSRPRRTQPFLENSETEMIRYYVTDRSRGNVIEYAARAIRDGVDMIQIREKDLAARELFELACGIRDIASGTKTRILINDRLDIALAASIDGVHLPGNGL